MSWDFWVSNASKPITFLSSFDFLENMKILPFFNLFWLRLVFWKILELKVSLECHFHFSCWKVIFLILCSTYCPIYVFPNQISLDKFKLLEYLGLNLAYFQIQCFIERILLSIDHFSRKLNQDLVLEDWESSSLHD